MLVIIKLGSRLLVENYCPSLLLSLNDPFIDSNMLAKAQTLLLDLKKFNLDYYKDDDNLDFYKSKSTIVRQFPKTMIIIATKDPFRDEGYILTDFLLRHNVNVKLREFLYYCHGVVSFPFHLNYNSQNDENEEIEGKNFIMEVFGEQNQ